MNGLKVLAGCSAAVLLSGSALVWWRAWRTTADLRFPLSETTWLLVPSVGVVVSAAVLAWLVFSSRQATKKSPISPS